MAALRWPGGPGEDRASTDPSGLGSIAPTRSTERRAAAMEPPGELPPVSDEMLRTAFARSPTGLTIVSPEGRWLWANDAFCRMLLLGRAELLGVSNTHLTHPDDVGRDREFLQAALSGERDSAAHETRYMRKDGSLVWAWVRTQVIRGDAGEPLSFVSHVQDITERRHARDLLRESERTLRAVIDNTPAMICVKGRDHRYKLVNREFELTYGKSSDWIVGRSDAELLPPSTLAEVHAKELAVLDSGESSQEETARPDGPRARILLITRFPLSDGKGVIDAVGIAATDITERRVEEHLKREHLECSQSIYSALAEDRFVLHGQPIVAFDSAKPEKTELLIRMRDPDGGTELRAPGRFLPAAERFGLITVVDDWVVDRAIELAATHRVSVNVSARTVCTERQVDRIEHAIIASRAPAENLVFEITETAVADDLDSARSFATRMHGLGCGIALDDFGVGHGSFTYLRHLRVDYLKIDMQFVRDLLSNDEDRQVVAAIIGVARQFGIDTIAEGVEDQATLMQLRRMGVDYAQGYFTGRPMALDGCLERLGKQRRGAEHASSD